MTSIDVGMAALRGAATRLHELYDRLGVRLRRRVPARAMAVIDVGMAAMHAAAVRLYGLYDRITQWLKSMMPKGLYARALLIIIVPMVVLQSVVAFVFMERHWNTVTRHLSAAVLQDIAALIDVYKGYPQDKDRAQIRRIAQQRLGLVVD